MELAETEAALAAAQAEAAEAGDEPAAAEVTAEVRALQEEWFAAWNARDGAAVRSMMAAGGRHVCPATGADGVSGAALAAFVEEGWDMIDAEIVGAPCTHPPGDSAFVSGDCLVATEFTLNGRPGYLSVLHLRGPRAALRVLDHYAYP